jgi:hypothetical protein
VAAENSKKIWKIRTIKNYPEAHNHIFIGEVLNITDSYVRLKCRTYHFRRSVNGPKDIRIGEVGIRIIPWNRIEVINEIEPAFKYREAKLSLEANKVILSDGIFSYIVASSYDSRY